MSTKEILKREARFVESYIRKNVHAKPMFRIAEELNNTLDTNLTAADIEMLVESFELNDSYRENTALELERKAEKSASRKRFWGGVAKGAVVLAAASMFSSKGKK